MERKKILVAPYQDESLDERFSVPTPSNDHLGRKRDLGLKVALTEKLVRQFCDLIAQGHPPDAVCDYLLVPKTSFHRWLRFGELYIEGNQEPKEHWIFGKFVAEFRRAGARYRVSMVNRLHTSSKRTWIRDLAILERRDRRHFGRNEPSGGAEEVHTPDERFL